MSHDTTPNSPAPRMSREAVRAKAQQVSAQQKRARLMRRMLIGAVVLLVVAGAGTAVAMTVTSSVTKPTLSPSNMDGDGVAVREAVTLSSSSADLPDAAEADAEGEPEAAAEATDDEDAEAEVEQAAGVVDIHIYVDYLSPGAGEFERANARQLGSWIEQGAANVVYHPVALLTASSNGTKYSARAAGAAACVATYSPDQFYVYNHELLVKQPDIDSDGKTDQDLADLAVAVGIDDVKKVRTCIQERDYTSWAKDATARALEGPLPGSEELTLNGAPMIVINGQAYVGSLSDPTEFAQFVMSVASDAYYSTPDATATPTPEATTTPAS
ncbi:DsbA family protein [Microbacterium sp. YY-01]|uniref:DsbA family protein n=1 Tax=Microbacterium sp. YY-01 TaxID=3421634 RepID=UPI003D171E5B